MGEDERERLGRVARDAWVVYCRETGDEKPAHVAPWEELGEWDQEADRRIADAVAAEVRRQERAKVAALVEVAEQEAAASHRCDFEMLSYLDGLRAALAALERGR